MKKFTLMLIAYALGFTAFASDLSVDIGKNPGKAILYLPARDLIVTGVVGDQFGSVRDLLWKEFGGWKYQSSDFLLLDLTSAKFYKDHLKKYEALPNRYQKEARAIAFLRQKLGAVYGLTLNMTSDDQQLFTSTPKSPIFSNIETMKLPRNTIRKIERQNRFFIVLDVYKLARANKFADLADELDQADQDKIAESLQAYPLLAAKPTQKATPTITLESLGLSTDALGVLKRARVTTLLMLMHINETHLMSVTGMTLAIASELHSARLRVALLDPDCDYMLANPSQEK